MYPTLISGDVVLACKKNAYCLGDILVFKYKNEDELLIHRLLKKDRLYYCKGDNAFAMEAVTYQQIIGKAFFVNKSVLSTWPTWKIALSFLVNRTFMMCSYDVEKTRQTEVYRYYEEHVINRTEPF